MAYAWNYIFAYLVPSCRNYLGRVRRHDLVGVVVSLRVGLKPS